MNTRIDFHFFFFWPISSPVGLQRRIRIKWCLLSGCDFRFSTAMIPILSHRLWLSTTAQSRPINTHFLSNSNRTHCPYQYRRLIKPCPDDILERPSILRWSERQCDYGMSTTGPATQYHSAGLVDIFGLNMTSGFQQENSIQFARGRKDLHQLEVVKFHKTGWS